MNKYLKLVIAALLLAASVYFFSQREYGWGFTFAFLTVLPIFFFFRNEYILLAFWQLRKQDINKTQQWLSKIKNPNNQLIRQQYGYHQYMLGLVSGQTNINASEKHMKKALDYGLSFKHDRAMANLTLAGTAMGKGRKKEAEQYLKTAKELDTQGMMTEQIKMMQQQMKRVNIGRNLQNPNMRRRGKFN